jgi:hypothetical protein
MISWYGSTYFLNDFEMVPVAPIITGITPVFTFHLLLLLLLLLLFSLALQPRAGYGFLVNEVS